MVVCLPVNGCVLPAAGFQANSECPVHLVFSELGTRPEVCPMSFCWQDRSAVCSVVVLHVGL